MTTLAFIYHKLAGLYCFNLVQNVKIFQIIVKG